jgi:Holliday junction resolvase RusA-like endonuclease
MGKKIRTYDYNKYRKVLLEELPSNVRVPSGELTLQMNVYYSNKACDTDNCIKPFVDILQEKYGFNDNRIYHIWIQKILVPKGDEGILFRFKKYKGEIKW